MLFHIVRYVNVYSKAFCITLRYDPILAILLHYIWGYASSNYRNDFRNMVLEQKRFINTAST